MTRNGIWQLVTHEPVARVCPRVYHPPAYEQYELIDAWTDGLIRAGTWPGVWNLLEH